MFQEGPFANNLFMSSGAPSLDITVQGSRGIIRSRIVDQTLESDVRMAQKAEQMNAVQREINDRVTAALRPATGNDFSDDPVRWWDWWLAYNEMYQPSVKPTYTTVRYSPPTAVTMHYVSCFPAGTLVETSTGPIAIEVIKPGDCVLAQDADTGELAYKPVMMTTVRPPSKLIETRIEEETIRATRGHPFWVSGLGWQMAKELLPGSTCTQSMAQFVSPNSKKLARPNATTWSSPISIHILSARPVCSCMTIIYVQ